MENYSGNYMRRTDVLLKLSEEDEEYRLWQSEYEQSKKKLERIEKFLPKSFVRTIHACADYRAMALQRTISIACMCMEFTGEHTIPLPKPKKERILQFVPKKEK